MSKRIFTHAQLALLRQNKNIAAVTEKVITYNPKFKLAAIQRYQEGIPPSEIFREAGFNLAIIGRKTPKWRLTKWRRLFEQQGARGLLEDGRTHRSGSRPPNPVFKNEKEKLKYLEAQVAYLKAENAFLAKLRKQRLNYGRTSSTGSSRR